MAASFAKSVGRVLYPRVADFAKPPAKDQSRTDSDDDDAEDDYEREQLANETEATAEELDAEADELVRNLRRVADGSFDEEQLRKHAKTAASRSLAHSQREFDRLKIQVKKEPKLKWLLDGWEKDTVARIKGMHAEQLDKILALLKDGRGHRAETVQAEIERQVKDVPASRAEFIGRSSVLSLNAKITRERQTAAGIEKYVWSTSQDERVRPEHAALEGKTFDWDKGDPIEGHPGDAPYCRCVAYPIVPELDVDGGDDDE